MMRRWLAESERYDGLYVNWRAERIVHREHTGFQEVVIFDHSLFGRVLMLDGVVQTTTADEAIYHESLAYIPALLHGSVRRVLIVGGGDGGCLRRVLALRGVERVVMAEIDVRVVELSRLHLGEICGSAFADRRLALRETDGASYVRACEESFDLAIVDSTDPGVEIGAGLFSEDFYRSCRSRLNPGGLLVTQNAMPFLSKGSDLCGPLRNLASVFPSWSVYAATVPSFFGGEMAYALGCSGDLRAPGDAEALAGRLARDVVSPPVCYDVDHHMRSFSLPFYMRDAVAEVASALGGGSVRP